MAVLATLISHVVFTEQCGIDAVAPGLVKRAVALLEDRDVDEYGAHCEKRPDERRGFARVRKQGDDRTISWHTWKTSECETWPKVRLWEGERGRKDANEKCAGGTTHRVLDTLQSSAPRAALFLALAC